MSVPLQVVHEQLAPAWTVIDNPDQGALDTVAAADRAAPVSFDAGPALRATVVVLGVDRAVLILTVPSVFADGTSLTTLVDEIAARYAGQAPADEPLQYADFAAWQHELADGLDGDAEQGRAFWADLGPAAAPAIPFLRSVPDQVAADREQVPLSAETAEALNRCAEQFGVAPELVALAAWHVLLGLVSGSNDVAVSVVLPGRLHTELVGSVGALARPVPVRASLAETTTFAEVLDRVARAAGEAASWQDYVPADATAPGAGFVAVDAMSRVDGGDMAFASRNLTLATDGHAVALEWVRVGETQRGTLVYDAAAFGRVDAARLAEQLGRVLEVVVERPETPIEKIDLVGDDERRQILFDFNNTAAEKPATTIDALVREATAASPGQIAVVDDAGAITYAELDQRVNELAHRLRQLGVRPGVVVGLCTDRSADMVVALLGILRAGGAYLPLNFEHPRARLAHQLAETSAPVLVTQSALADHLPQFEGTTIQLDADRKQLQG
jgi:hypothetical protein